MSTWRSGLGVWAGIIVVVSCTSATSPYQPGVQWVVGNGQQDTIQAVLAQALVVRVAAKTGRLAGGTVVQFQSVMLADTGLLARAPEAYVQSETQGAPGFSLVDTTDANGLARAVITLGVRAGESRVVVSVPSDGYVDTATFTTMPGQAASLPAGPSDTALYVGNQLTLHTEPVDREGNARTDSVHYAGLSGPVTLSGTSVTGMAYGRAAIVGSSGALSDTTYISVVPQGTLAAALDTGGIVMFNLDGSQYTPIASLNAGTVRWLASGAGVVFDQMSSEFGGGSNLLQSVTLEGQITVLDSSPNYVDVVPMVSHDGTWIYFTKVNGIVGENPIANPIAVRVISRVHPDGSGTDSINRGSYGVPAPTGASLVFIHEAYDTSPYMEIEDTTTGVTTSLSEPAFIAMWSPLGNTLAYLAPIGGASVGGEGVGVLALVNSDGTDQRWLSANEYWWAYDWSPDGQWIVARNLTTSKVDVINVASGMTLPLGYTGALGSPTWKPTVAAGTVSGQGGRGRR